MDQMEYLESERKKIWGKLTELESLIEKRTADYEQEARQSSKKSSEFRNKCEISKNEAQTLTDEIQKIAQDIKQSNVSELIGKLNVTYNNLIPRTEAIEAKLQRLETLFASYTTYADQINKLSVIAESADESSNKIEALVKQFVSKKGDIDKLYFEIFGYPVTNQQSDEVVVLGKKDELEQAYVQLKNEFDKFSKEKNEELSKTVDGWQLQFHATHSKIESLLPNALTAGLSAAYSRKKEAEIDDHQRLEKQFEHSIMAMIVVSLILFSSSIFMLFNGKSFEETILMMPRLVLAILPLYIPIFWFAYSLNRKMNLSKRLIEEYTHKEVLSKTFEGLSTQIQNISHSETSSDLKTRLLYNILEVSSENPGKLISNYDKSDHPLMDALDKSVKLSNAIEHLAKVPGMSRLVGILEKKSNELLEIESKKVIDAIEKVAIQPSTVHNS